MILRNRSVSNSSSDKWSFMSVRYNACGELNRSVFFFSCCVSAEFTYFLLKEVHRTSSWTTSAFLPRTFFFKRDLIFQTRVDQMFDRQPAASTADKPSELWIRTNSQREQGKLDPNRIRTEAETRWELRRPCSSGHFWAEGKEKTEKEKRICWKSGE